MPAYNALGIFFGISQTRTPKGLFGRGILILFIWFCLIIRTCYQSMLFELMTGDMRKPLPETIHQAIDEGYQVKINFGQEHKNQYWNTKLQGRNLEYFY